MDRNENRTLENLSNTTMQFYLDMMRDTETPPIMHAWSLISAASACMTRRRWFQMGALKFWPNQFIFLTGPAGVRKSTAISFARKLVEDIENFRFGPNNTGGRMQGLVSAMMGFKSKEETEEEAAVEAALDGIMGSMNLTKLVDSDMGAEENQFNRSSLWVAESEAVTFIGRQMDDFITFLGDIWDCPDQFHYQVKRESMKVQFPCLNIIGGITPLHITTYLPPQAIGQGFSSRVIFVYAGVEENKRIPWPEPLDPDKWREMKAVIHAIYSTEPGAFGYTAEAKDMIIKLYDYRVPIDDVRFIHYAQRRQAHLIKVAMALCALRLDDTVTAGDITDAHALLVLTESRMQEALGTHGLTDAALARARLLEFLRSQTQPATITRIIVACGADVKRQEIQRALHEMLENGNIVQVTLQDEFNTKKVGFVLVRQGNAFKRNAVIKVDYNLDEVAIQQDSDGVRSKAVSSAVSLLSEEAQPVRRDVLEKQVAANQRAAERQSGAENSVAARLASIRATRQQ